jgi:hypothetical protein
MIDSKSSLFPNQQSDNATAVFSSRLGEPVPAARWTMVMTAKSRLASCSDLPAPARGQRREAAAAVAVLLLPGQRPSGVGVCGARE